MKTPLLLTLNWRKISDVGTACHNGVRWWKVYLSAHASIAEDGDNGLY